MSQQALLARFTSLRARLEKWTPDLARLVRAARDASLDKALSQTLTTIQLDQKILLLAFLSQSTQLQELVLAIKALLDVAFERAWSRDRDPTTSSTPARKWAREIFTFQRFPDLAQLEQIQQEVHAWMQRMTGFWDTCEPQLPTASLPPWERHCKECTTIAERLRCPHSELDDGKVWFGFRLAL